MSTKIQQLKELVTTIHPFSESEWNTFSELWKPFETKRKEQLTIPGQTERYLYFVTEGVQRVFYFDDQGREATLVFTYAPSFGGVLDSMMQDTPSKYFYETLTPSSFLRASYSDMEQLSNDITGVNLLIRKGLVNALSGVMERLVEIQTFSSEDRFKKLLQRSPHILQLVPHKYLANYLGIDPTNFSKLINKVKI